MADLTRAFANLSPQERDIVIRTLIGEAGNQGAIGQQAVAAVIGNRAIGSGESPGQVALAPHQFEPWNTSAGRARLMAIDPNGPRYQSASQAFDEVATGRAPDPTGGATHFYSPTAQAALGRSPPSWAQGPSTDIGQHRFYNLGYGGSGAGPNGIPPRPPADIPNVARAAAQPSPGAFPAGMAPTLASAQGAGPPAVPAGALAFNRNAPALPGTAPPFPRVGPNGGYPGFPTQAPSDVPPPPPGPPPPPNPLAGSRYDDGTPQGTLPPDNTLPSQPVLPFQPGRVPSAGQVSAPGIMAPPSSPPVMAQQPSVAPVPTSGGPSQLARGIMAGYGPAGSNLSTFREPATGNEILNGSVGDQNIYRNLGKTITTPGLSDKVSEVPAASPSSQHLAEKLFDSPKDQQSFQLGMMLGGNDPMGFFGSGGNIFGGSGGGGDFQTVADFMGSYGGFG